MIPKSIPETNNETTVKYWLKHGDIASIAKKHNVTRSYVSNILNPKIERSNTEIMDSLIELATQRKTEASKRKEQIESLAS
jgi:hypothetical protein